MNHTLRMFGAPTVQAHTLDRHYHVLSFCEVATTFTRKEAGLAGIRLQDGQLFIDELPILEPYFGKDMITWNQQVEGHFSSGHLFFQRGGAELLGTVYRGTSAEDATEHHVLATTIPTVEYKTQITKQRYPDGTPVDKVPAGDWDAGLKLGISYEMAVGDSVPSPKVYLDDQDITLNTSWMIDPKTQQLQLILNVGEDMCVFDSSLYMKGIISFDQLQPVPPFVGTVSSTCANKEGSGMFLWKGEVMSSLRTADLQPGQLGAARAFTPLTLARTDLVQSSDLTVGVLMSIVPDDKVSEMANSMLTENMKWAMAQSSEQKEWLSQFFGQQPPVLPVNRQELVKKSLDWYQNKFAKSYLGWAVANYDGPNKPSTNLNDDQKLKLKEYLQTGMAKNSDFNVQQNGIFLDAFVAAKPLLQKFIDDGGAKWAQTLYDTITSPPQMVLMINRVWGAAGTSGAMTPANNFATLLSALQPSGELAKKYIYMVLNGSLSNSAHQTTFKDKDTVMQWLPDFLQEFLNQIAVGGTVPDQARIVEEQLKLMISETAGGMNGVAQTLSEFVINANGATIMEKTGNMETAFAQKFPRFAKVGQMMFFTAWCMGIVFVVKAFQNWKELKPTDKARAVTTAINLGFQALDVVPQFISGLKQMGAEGWKKFTLWRSSSSAVKPVGEINEIAAGEGGVAEVGATETSALLDTGTRTIKTTGTFWERAFAFASKVVAVVAVLASVVFSVLSAIDFVNDIKEGQPITKTAFDGVLVVVNVATTVCLVLDLFVATTVFAMAAAVLAIVGIIISIIAMFVVKPKNPLDTFMQNVVVPFVNGLKDPPKTTALLRTTNVTLGVSL